MHEDLTLGLIADPAVYFVVGDLNAMPLLLMGGEVSPAPHRGSAVGSGALWGGR